ncbi:MAG: hypothetical protein IPN13_04245 [Bacteroidetes bacterium]|nr:hypothetical protein [Bacteroidota bacterium]
MTLSLCCLSISFANAQTTKYFKKTFGDPYPFYEAGHSVHSLIDGYLVSGYSVNPNPYDADAFIVRTDLFGNSLWSFKSDDTSTQTGIFTSFNLLSNYFLPVNFQILTHQVQQGFL